MRTGNKWKYIANWFLHQHYVVSNSLTNGSHNPTKRCHELQASTAFFWFLMATFLGTLALAAMNMGGMRRGASTRKGPSMTQV